MGGSCCTDGQWSLAGSGGDVVGAAAVVEVREVNVAVVMVVSKIALAVKVAADVAAVEVRWRLLI